MRKALILAVILCGVAIPQEPCGADPWGLCGKCASVLPEKWNRFASASRLYVETLAGGVKDLRLRRSMLKAWDEVNACECF